MDNGEIEHVAFGIVEAYLIEGPEFIDIVEAVEDYREGASEDDFDAVALVVRNTLTKLATTFNISN